MNKEKTPGEKTPLGVFLRNNNFMSYNIISTVSHFTAFCCKDKLKYEVCGKMIMCIIVSGYKSAVSQIFWREILLL